MSDTLTILSTISLAIGTVIAIGMGLYFRKLSKLEDNTESEAIMLDDFFKSYQRSYKIRVRVVYAVLIAVIIIGLVRLFMYLA